MKLVQWIGKDGGWKTGEVVELATGYDFTGPCPVTRSRNGFELSLVRHSHTGELEFVFEGILNPRPMRSEMGEHAEPIKKT